MGPEGRRIGKWRRPERADDDNNDDDEDDEDDNENLPPTHGHRQMCNISIHQYLLVNDADEVCSRTLDLDVFL